MNTSAIKSMMLPFAAAASMGSALTAELVPDKEGSKFIPSSTSMRVSRGSLTKKQITARVRAKRAKQARKLNR